MLKHLYCRRIEMTDHRMGKATANITITPEHELYDALMRYTAEGMRMKLDQGEFSVTRFAVQGRNLVIWLEEVE